MWVGRLDMKKAGEGRVDEIKATLLGTIIALVRTLHGTRTLWILLSLS